MSKSDRPLFHWPSIVLSWVNLFEVEPISNVSSIRNTNFIAETIDSIFKHEQLKHITFKNSDDLAVKFIKEYFPEIIREKKFYLRNEDDALILTSLLMYITCVKYKLENFISKTCSMQLDALKEEALKKFFELMIKVEDGQFTRKNIFDVIHASFEPEHASARKKSIGSPCLKEFLGSPTPHASAGIKSIGSPSLKEFLESPTQQKHMKNKEVSDIRHLNVLLQEENAELLTERDFLTKQNQKLDASIEKLQTQLTEKSDEIKSLKEELKQFEEKGDITSKLEITKIEKKKNGEINQLQKELKELQSEIDNMHNKHQKYTNTNSDLKQELQKRESDLLENFKIIEQLQSKVQELELKNKALETSVKDLNEIIENVDDNTRPRDLSISCPRVEENLGQVLLDLELKEKCEEIEQLQRKLESLETICKEKEEKIDRYEESEKKHLEELASKSSTLEDTRSSLSEVQEKLRVCETELRDHTEQVKVLRTQGEALEQDLSARVERVQELETQLALSLENSSQLKSLVDEKGNQIEQMNKQIEMLSKESEECQLKNAKQAEQIKKLVEEESSLKEELQSKCLIIKSKANALDDLSNQLKDCKAQLETQTVQSNELQTKIETMGKEMSASLAAQTKLEVKLADSLKKLAQLNSDVADREHQIEQMSRSIDALTEDNKEHRMKNTHLGEQLKKKEVTEKKLQEELNSKCFIIENSNSALNDVKNQLKNCESELKSQIALAKKLKTKCENLEQDFSVNLSKHIEVEAQLADSMNCKAQLESVIVEKDRKIDEIENTIEILSQEKNQYELKISYQAEKVKQYEELEKKLLEEVQSQRLLVESKTNALIEVGDQLEILQTELMSQTDKANQLQIMSDTLKKDLSASLDKNNELARQLEDLLNNVADIKNTVADRETQIVSLKKSLESVSEEKKDLELRIAHQDGEIKQLEISKRDLENKFDSKSQAFDELTRSSQRLQEQFHRLTEEAVGLKGELSSASLKVTELETQLGTKDQEAEERLSQLQVCIDNLEILNVEMKQQMEDQASHLKEKISELESKIEVKEGECFALKKKLDDVNIEVLSLQSEYDVLLVKNRELTSQLSSVTTGAAHLENVIQEDHFKIDLQERTIKKLECSIQEKEDTIVKLNEELLSLKNLSDEAKTLVLEKDSQLSTQLNTKDCEIESLKRQIQGLTKDIEDLNNILKPLEVNQKETMESNTKLLDENAKLRSDLSEQVDKIGSVEKELHAQNELVLQMKSELDAQSKKLEEANAIQENIVKENESLKAQLGNADPQLKEAYQQLLEEFQRLNDEHDEAKDQQQKVRAAVRAEYDEILKKMKAHMKSTCTRALEVKEEKHAKELRVLQETVKSHQDHNSQLSTNLWDTSDKLLIVRNENEELRKENDDLKKSLMELKRLHMNQSITDGLHRTRSHDHLGLQSQKALRMVEEETVTVSRRQSFRTVPSGIGKVFPSEDEAEEMFNNDCLADLKAGRCQIKADPDRVSTLMYRNSLCPPHLKSSYPAETQFLPVDTMQEDDIKGRGLGDDAKLLPDKRRKDRSQASETRSVAASPRTALREVNDENRKPGTPSRLFSNIFSARQRRNENITSTPDRRRLSFFGKLVKKEPSE